MRKLLKYVFYAFMLMLIIAASVFTYVYINRDKILGKITQTLNKQYNAQFIIKDLRTTFFSDFPHFSLTLIDAEIRDSKYNIYHTPLLKADKIYLQANLLAFLKGSIKVSSLEVEDASVNLFKTHDGYTNNIFKLKDQTVKDTVKSTSSIDFTINDMAFRQVKILITDSVRHNSYGILFLKVNSSFINQDSITAIKIKGSVYFDGLTFKEIKGPFLDNQQANIDFNLSYINGAKFFTINKPSQLAIGQSEFNLSGSINLADHPYLQLRIESNAVTFAIANAVVNRNLAKKLARFKYQGTVKTDLNIIARLDIKGQDPKINMKFSATDVSTEIAGTKFQHASFNAIFNNTLDSLIEPGNENSRVDFTNVNAQMEGLPIKGSFYITDIANAQINAKFSSSFNLAQAQHLVNASSLLLKKGKVNVVLHYVGPAEHMVDSVNKKVNAYVNGTVNLSGGEIFYVKRDFNFTNINTEATYDSRDVIIKNLSLIVNNTQLNANGLISKIIPFLLVPDQKVLAQLKLSSPFINLSSFIPDKPMPLTRPPSKEQRKAANKVQTAKVAHVVDKVIEMTDVDLAMQATRMTFKNFSAENLHGTVSIHNEDVTVKKLSFKSSDGEFLMDAILTNTYKLNAIVKVENADAKLIFTSFDNFHQDKLKAENIGGKLSALVNYSCKLDNTMQIIPSSMKGEMNLTFNEGKLMDVFTIGKIGKVLFNEENVNYIEFDRINANAILDGYDLNIEKIDIASSYMSLIISGVYSFKGNTDLSIQVPLANLKRKKVKEKLNAEKLEAYDGANVYLRAKPGKDGKLSVSYDPFKKRRERKAGN